MQIYLFTNFTKRENSTKRPALSSGTRYNCRLKNPTSAINPVIEIDQNDQMEFKNYSYAYIPDFFRYYMVADIVSDGHFWIYSLETDVLATYRQQIGAASLYMLRSSDQYNGYIMDNYYPATGNRYTVTRDTPTPWSAPGTGQSTEQINIENGTFILGVVAIPYPTGAGSYGSIKYLALTQEQMVTLITELLDNTITEANHFSTDDATLQLQKSIINPLSYIKSCIWVPIRYENITGIVMQHGITIWTWTIEAECKLITQDPPYMQFATNLVIPPHPQAEQRGQYLNLSPFTRLSICYPPFGLIDLDTSLFINETNVQARVLVDLITGSAQLDVYAGPTLTHRIKSQVGVPIQLTEVSYEYGLNVETGVGIAAEAVNRFLGSILPSGISNAVSQIGDAANAMRTKQSSLGSNGSFAELRGHFYLYADFNLVPDEDRSHAGRPLCRIVRPDTRPTGTYYMALLGDIALPDGTVGEHAEVKSYLEGGFYYE